LNIQLLGVGGKMLMWIFIQRNCTKKRSTISYGAIIKHFHSANPYKNDDAQQQKFMKDLLLFVAKTYMPIFIVES
jgi:hypothetical protein